MDCFCINVTESLLILIGLFISVTNICNLLGCASVCYCYFVSLSESKKIFSSYKYWGWIAVLLFRVEEIFYKMCLAVIRVVWEMWNCWQLKRMV